MPAARDASIMSLSIGGAQASTQPHELLTTSGAFDGSGLLPALSVGAMNHCMQSMYVGTTPTPLFMFLQAIHSASGAMPIWLAPPSSPTIVPTVCVPWSLSSHGTVPSKHAWLGPE